MPIHSTTELKSNRTATALLLLCSLLPAARLAGAESSPAPNAPPARTPAFKGNWQGPSQQLLPGPGPKPGQSLPDYFASLPPGDRRPSKLHVLVLGGTRGFHHDSVPAAMNCIYEAGKRSSLWDTEFATDFDLVNAGGGAPMKAGFQPKGLKDFDAVVVASASGDWRLSDEQKAALLAFVHDAGKGIVAVHAGMDANHEWRDYIDMIGGEFTGHPFNSSEHVLVSFPIINESQDFPIVHHLPKELRKQDEIYIVRNFTRSDANVLLRLDAAKLDYSANPGLATQIPPDHDFPVAWTKRYGKGRVFASSIGHPAEAFDDPDVSTLYLEATKWVLGLTEGDEQPHPPRN